MTDFKIKNGRLTLKNGILTVRSLDLDPPKAETDGNTSTPIADDHPKPKTTAQRQRELYERRKADGWRKVWVDPKTLKLAEMLGGIDRISADREAWIAKATTSGPRPWWRFW